MENPGREHWEVMKRIIRYIKMSFNVALYLGGFEFIIKGYMDSDFAGDIDNRKSITR